MAANNLRIIYQNSVDLSTTTISTSNSADGANTPKSNLQLDSKSLVWRSTPNSTVYDTNSKTYTVKTNIVLSFSTANSPTIGGIMLPFCNLSTVATVRVRGYSAIIPTTGTATATVGPTATTPGSLLFDTGTVRAAPYQVLGLWDWGSLPLGVNSYSYGGGTYGRCWLPSKQQVPAQYILIELVDTANSSPYIELSRLIVGPYWSPTYNTSFGLSTSVKDLSSHMRSESGDLVTTRGIKFNSMNFDLKWLTPTDRLQFSMITKGNGISRPIFISLFPDNLDNWEKEQAHQIYGKLSQLSDIQHPIFDTYSSQVEIEEV
ncbi:hypothetical protein UFOVP961_132 [uncultured Caudovirales phage]|uniref:Uncharacterized protein n=1 Tax=uncultured Caudovirales phage TaxID=2100421 RepID=A0A6J5SQ04_9CAUD|nr:hypothetical protein UFOVP961_132 [uncultured Caudovirales phage]CAB4185373.1 hypothetical protein UFOVP1123_60 [uncultured Caudovirales phage]CAB4193486.1 hypothetical protein UFOVP1239_90 [uncultured Caudovirales phage]CAB4216036.1 hypothetical protein UFOVP1484_64 [uncultured Caudovirales phage]CAB5230712.1 hypothetical protein UFOVP1577_70 [uncultured Caudovirales phage]